MLKHNWKQATRLLSSIMLALLMGCAQDSSLTEPKLMDNDGNIDFRGNSPDPGTDCKCFMQVRNAVNAPSGGFDAWVLADVTPGGSGNYEEEGSGNQWLNIGVGYMAMPSPSRELKTPSNGVHMFYLNAVNFAGNPPSPNFTINTVVRCYLTNPDGSEGPLMTTTFHSFRWDQGTTIPGGDSPPAFVRSFQREFSCYTLTEPIGPIPG